MEQTASSALDSPAGPVSEPTARRGDTRGRIIDVALRLFNEQGYDATTVAAIAERACLTKATFFRHFPDKREVLFAGQE